MFTIKKLKVQNKNLKLKFIMDDKNLQDLLLNLNLNQMSNIYSRITPDQFEDDSDCEDELLNEYGNSNEPVSDEDFMLMNSFNQRADNFTQVDHLTELIDKDCKEAEADKDLMAFYNAGLRQNDIDPTNPITEEVELLARVILPQRVVEVIKANSNTFNVKTVNLETVKDNLMSKLTPFELDLLMDILCKFISLFIRDFPDKVDAGMKESYQFYRMIMTKRGQDCCIL